MLVVVLLVLLVRSSLVDVSIIGFRVAFYDYLGSIEVFYSSKKVFRDLSLLVVYKIVGGAYSVGSNNIDYLVDGVD